MKALVLAAGNSARFGSSKNKCMVEVGGAPLIERVVSKATEANSIKEVIVVVNNDREGIMKHLGHSYNGKKLKYVLQEDLNGIVGAIEMAIPFIDDSDFMLFLADEYMFESRVQEMIDDFYEREGYVSCGVCPTERFTEVKQTYTVLVDKDRVVDIVEKPENPFNSLIGTGVCAFKNDVLPYVISIPVKLLRGFREVTIADLIKILISYNKKIIYYFICSKYFNINKKSDLISLNSYINSK